jgi:hypothetical protein
MSMKRKSLVIGGIAVTAALAGGLALAQTVGPGSGGEGMGPGMMMNGMGHGMGPGMMMKGMGHGMGHGMGPGMMQGGPASGFADPAELDQLKAELAIKPAQEQAWNTYAKAVGDAAAAQKTSAEGVDRQAVGKMKPADRFAYVSKMREQAQTQFARVKAAADELLATLDDEQKAEAREILPGLAESGPGMTRGAGMGGPRHRH